MAQHVWGIWSSLGILRGCWQLGSAPCAAPGWGASSEGPPPPLFPPTRRPGSTGIPDSRPCPTTPGRAQNWYHEARLTGSASQPTTIRIPIAHGKRAGSQLEASQVPKICDTLAGAPLVGWLSVSKRRPLAAALRCPEPDWPVAHANARVGAASCLPRLSQSAIFMASWTTMMHDSQCPSFPGLRLL